MQSLVLSRTSLFIRRLFPQIRPGRLIATAWCAVPNVRLYVGDTRTDRRDHFHAADGVTSRHDSQSYLALCRLVIPALRLHSSGGSTLEQGVQLTPSFLALHPQFRFYKPQKDVTVNNVASIETLENQKPACPITIENAWWNFHVRKKFHKLIGSSNSWVGSLEDRKNWPKVPACLAGVKAGCVHLSRVAGNCMILYGKWHSIAVSWSSINSYTRPLRALEHCTPSFEGLELPLTVSRTSCLSRCCGLRRCRRRRNEELDPQQDVTDWTRTAAIAIIVTGAACMQHDRLLAWNCRPSVRLSVRLCPAKWRTWSATRRHWLDSNSGRGRHCRDRIAQRGHDARRR